MKNYFKTWWFWLALGVVLSLVGILIHPVVSYVGIGLLAGIVSIFILYAFIINPINDFCKRPEKTILKHFHRPVFAIPFCFPRIVNTFKEIKYYVDLTDTTAGESNHTNKLFGNAIGFNVHKDSFRFVYSERNKEIFAYYYINGKRKMESLNVYNNGVGPVVCTLLRNKKGVIFTAEHLGNETKVVVPFVSKRKYGLKLGLYYGGEKRADRKIKITLFKM